MTQFNSRLLTKPVLRQMVELTDDISGHGQDVAEALADYENADDLPSGERTEAREEARDDFVSAIGELIAAADRLREVYARVTASMDDPSMKGDQR